MLTASPGSGPKILMRSQLRPGLRGLLLPLQLVAGEIAEGRLEGDPLEEGSVVLLWA
jgi:hypothetical protein